MDNRELWRADKAAIADLRRRLGWSRTRLALTAGISPHTVAKIERGEPVFPPVLLAVATALGVSAMDLRAGFEASTEATQGNRLVDALQDYYAAYGAALKEGDLEITVQAMAKFMSRSIRWSYASTRSLSLEGSVIGRDALIRHLWQALSSIRGVPEVRIDRIDHIAGRHELVARGVERFVIEVLGFVTGNWLHVVEFDRRGRIIRFQIAFDVISIEPVQHSSEV